MDLVWWSGLLVKLGFHHWTPSAHLAWGLWDCAHGGQLCDLLLPRHQPPPPARPPSGEGNLPLLLPDKGFPSDLNVRILKLLKNTIFFKYRKKTTNWLFLPNFLKKTFCMQLFRKKSSQEGHLLWNISPQWLKHGRSKSDSNILINTSVLFCKKQMQEMRRSMEREDWVSQQGILKELEEAKGAEGQSSRELHSFLRKENELKIDLQLLQTARIHHHGVRQQAGISSGVLTSCTQSWHTFGKHGSRLWFRELNIIPAIAMGLFLQMNVMQKGFRRNEEYDSP